MAALATDRLPVVAGQIVQLVPGHTKIESTVRWLGGEADDAPAISEQADVWNRGGEAVALRITYIGGNAPVPDLPDNKPSRLVFYECKPSAVGRPARNIDSTLPAEEFAQGTWFSPG